MAQKGVVEHRQEENVRRQRRVVHRGTRLNQRIRAHARGNISQQLGEGG